MLEGLPMFAGSQLWHQEMGGALHPAWVVAKWAMATKVLQEWQQFGGQMVWEVQGQWWGAVDGIDNGCKGRGGWWGWYKIQFLFFLDAKKQQQVRWKSTQVIIWTHRVAMMCHCQRFISHIGFKPQTRRMNGISDWQQQFFTSQCATKCLARLLLLWLWFSVLLLPCKQELCLALHGRIVVVSQKIGIWMRKCMATTAFITCSGKGDVSEQHWIHSGWLDWYPPPTVFGITNYTNYINIVYAVLCACAGVYRYGSQFQHWYEDSLVLLMAQPDLFDYLAIINQIK